MATLRPDRRAPLWFLTALAAVLCAAMVIAFYELQMDAIFDRSETALGQAAGHETASSDASLPVVGSVSVAESSSRNNFTDVERAMVDYYEENTLECEKDEIWLFDSSGLYVYFMPLDTSDSKSGTATTTVEGAPASGDDSSREAVRLLYADVTFPVELVRLTTAVIAVFALFGLIVFVVAQRRVARNFDEDDEAMKSFFANASHELKTPLMAIRGYAEGVKTGIVDVDEGCDVIDRETERMAALVGDIMALSRIDAEVVEPHLARYDIRDVLYEAVEAVTPAASAKDVAIELDAPEPAMLTCDEDLVFSVFSNVLSNAVRHADGEVTVSLGRCDQAMVCEVSNDGAPISAQDAAHAFDRFYKGEQGSTGLGMALAREYARLHNGSLTVHVVGGRTVFRIRLPRG